VTDAWGLNHNQCQGAKKHVILDFRIRTDCDCSSIDFDLLFPTLTHFTACLNALNLKIVNRRMRQSHFLEVKAGSLSRRHRVAQVFPTDTLKA
jgi:hypothetical protein